MWAARNPGPYYVVEQHDRRILLHATDHVEEMEELRVRIETRAGIEAASEVRRGFAQGQGSVEVLEAYTLQSDGSRIAVPHEAIRTGDLGTGDDAAGFTGFREVVVVFPDVRVGSRVHLRLRKVDRLPLYTGHAIVEAWFDPHTPVESATITLGYARSLPLRFDARGAVTEPLPDEGGLRRVRFRYRRVTATPPGAAQVGTPDISDHVLATTFRDHIELGQAYQSGAHPSAAVTPRVKALAAEITRGHTTERGRVKALYEWVQRNIRYVNVRLGDESGSVPHPAEWVLANRFGDCKDQVALLEALLSSVGIESSPALLNGTGTYRLPPLAVATPLDHVILYVPGLNLYLDPTAQDTPFGALPWSLADKPIVLTALGRIARTPPPQARHHALTRVTRMRVLSSGEVAGGAHHVLTGLFATPWRREGARVATPLTEDEVTAMLAPALESGTGTRRWVREPSESGPVEFTTRFQLDPMVDLTRPSALTIPVGLGTAYLHTLPGQRPPAQRPFPYPCRSMVVMEAAEITFPREVRIVSIPRNSRYLDGTRLYTATYRLRQRTVEVERKYIVNHPGAVCDVEDHHSRKRVHRVITLDLKQPILIRPRTTSDSAPEPERATPARPNHREHS